MNTSKNDLIKMSELYVNLKRFFKDGCTSLIDSTMSFKIAFFKSINRYQTISNSFPHFDRHYNLFKYLRKSFTCFY